ncbi:MAG: hypothetical protein MPI95_04930 [Nitrosopumilus sp.]|nr:hypothetical protein [Nitrosopumilus sp.]MDA7943541.1 hypothetical protein [Nitrosopumilus sp.]MDA7953102.1 hypothetical protein [Nitrosopumilus sp.]MDA7958418.1 hypothetical protein [Nitrosopumilus sp.]MDA7960515.1 hypothetical protein [Nitrosopumilus sp.]
MASCSGCNASLGWKKYRFQKQWRIPGYFCRRCMEEVGRDFDANGRVTVPPAGCSGCGVQLYFPGRPRNRKLVCAVCRSAPPADRPVAAGLPPVPPRVPMMMGLFAAFGFLLMAAGFGYVVLVAPQQEAGLLHVVLGSTMSGAGFMLARKMLKVRRLVLGREA